ncbi:hypothetical protein EDD21DRAFT_403172 [Dissophora ornata]|nr:hypothetical protein EDD21DRAFT_403172 [Dissophora ornata]
MTGELIRKKAERVRDDLDISEAEIKASRSCLEACKKRQGIIERQRFGESGNIAMDLIESERPRIQETLMSHSWSDMYNMNETDLCKPLDAGIIKYYHKRFNRCILRRLEELDTVRVRADLDRAMGIKRASPLAGNPKDIAKIHVRNAIELLVEAKGEVTP